jgi:hypothetical protein
MTTSHDLWLWCHRDYKYHREERREGKEQGEWTEREYVEKRIQLVKGSSCKETSIYSLTSPASNPFQSCLYVFPMVSVHIWPYPHHSNSLAIINDSYWYSNIWWFCWLRHNQGQCLTIAHIGIVSHDPMAPSDAHWTSIFGRLGTRRLGTVISTISSVVWSSQGSLECSFWISLG